MRKFPVQSVACGATFTVAVTTAGGVFSWGLGEHGELGHGPDCRELFKPQALDVRATVHVRHRHSRWR